MTAGWAATQPARYRMSTPPRPPCSCTITTHIPRQPPRYELWTWQVTSTCPTHYRKLPLSVRVRILLDEGYRL